MLGEADVRRTDGARGRAGTRWNARPGMRRILGDLDAEVMEAIWARPAGQGTTVHAVYESLRRIRSLRHTSVTAAMARLARRGVLRVERRRSGDVYYSIYTRDELLSKFLELVRGRLPLRRPVGGSQKIDLPPDSGDFLQDRASEAVHHLVGGEAGEQDV